MSVTDQPLNNVQWLPRDVLRANTWNPNHVARPEMDLLRLSILTDGWTQPIVAYPDGEGYEIVDGFHRWTLSGTPEIAALTDGLVPVVVLTSPPEQRMASTIRHNRARGSHAVLRMADIVATLVDTYGIDPGEVARVIGADGEEVSRLLDRGSMVRRGRAPDQSFGQAWRPVPLEEMGGR